MVPVNEPPIKQEIYSADRTKVSYELMNKGGTAIRSPFASRWMQGAFLFHTLHEIKKPDDAHMSML